MTIGCDRYAGVGRASAPWSGRMTSRRLERVVTDVFATRGR
jgi:hypothetical protein